MLRDDETDKDGPYLPGAPRKDAKGRDLLVDVSNPLDDYPATEPPRYGMVGNRTVAALLVTNLGYLVIGERGISTFSLLDP